MKTNLFLIAVLFLIPNSGFASNKSDCEEWCATKNECEKCSTHIGCGTGYTHFKKFNGPGNNWFACKLTNFRERGEANRTDCESWCAGEERCKKCSDSIGCGRGFTELKSFTGSGKNWFACRTTKAASNSMKHKRWCESFCDRNSVCEKCSDTIGCGTGYKSVASFSHKGDRWFACAQSGGRFGDEIIGKEECEDWIANAEIRTEVTQYCSKTCGAGRTPIANIGGWRACTDTLAHQAAERNYRNCLTWCDENNACSKCSTYVGCGGGYRKLKTFTGGIYEDYFYACEKR